MFSGTSDYPLRENVKDLARAVGFDLAGVSAAEPTPETRFLREWLANGYAGSMSYLEKRSDQRVDPRRVLEGARSVVAVGLVYEQAGKEKRPAAADSSLAQVARYAVGDDYHDVMRDRLRALEAALAALVEQPVRSRSYVDTGPVAERVFAAYGGLGWIGKNTCLIHPRLGSYVFLGALITDLELETDSREPDHCGSCRLCLDACPTGALVAPYTLDARRCIAHATIEDPGPIPEQQREEHGNWVYGCDICQEVCPWNATPRDELGDALGLRERLSARPDFENPTLAWILELDLEAWRRVTRRSAMRRGRYRGLLRNALVAAGNSGDPMLRPLIKRHADGSDALLREHATWALSRLSKAGS